MKQPIQPLYKDEHGVLRFHPNKIVDWMLDAGREGLRFDLNTIACLPDVSREDYAQLMQLIGYSHSGFGGLSCATDEVYNAAYNMYTNGMTEEQARIADLTEKLTEVRRLVKELAPVLFHIHPNDLQE